ncbi:MAG: hypothetical protein V3V81_07865 [Candidatus Bathyarchaeia archaeon]
MTKDDTAQGKAETYFYNCHKCKKGNLSRDEVHRILTVKGWENEEMASIESVKYVCLECLVKKEE